MSAPIAHTIVRLQRILPVFQEMLDYCALEALESSEPGALSYDHSSETITYHLRVRGMDSSLFDMLHDVEDIWIIQGPGRGAN